MYRNKQYFGLSNFHISSFAYKISRNVVKVIDLTVSIYDLIFKYFIQTFVCFGVFFFQSKPVYFINVSFSLKFNIFNHT